MTLQKITKMKFGIIDEVYMNTIVNAVEEFMDMKPAIDLAIDRVSKLQSRPFMAGITKKTVGHTIDLVRADGSITPDVAVSWVYEWQAKQIVYSDPSEMVIGNTDPVLTSADVSETVAGQNSSDEIISGLAINLAEQGNVNTYNELGIVFGVDVKSDMYPLGFIPVGAEVDDIVFLHKHLTKDASIVFLFSKQGTHDGSCE